MIRSFFSSVRQFVSVSPMVADSCLQHHSDTEFSAIHTSEYDAEYLSQTGARKPKSRQYISLAMCQPYVRFSTEKTSSHGLTPDHDLSALDTSVVAGSATAHAAAHNTPAAATTAATVIGTITSTATGTTAVGARAGTCAHGVVVADTGVSVAGAAAIRRAAVTAAVGSSAVKSVTRRTDLIRNLASVLMSVKTAAADQGQGKKASGAAQLRSRMVAEVSAAGFKAQETKTEESKFLGAHHAQFRSPFQAKVHNARSNASSSYSSCSSLRHTCLKTLSACVMTVLGLGTVASHTVQAETVSVAGRGVGAFMDGGSMTGAEVLALTPGFKANYEIAYVSPLPVNKSGLDVSSVPTAQGNKSSKAPQAASVTEHTRAHKSIKIPANVDNYQSVAVKSAPAAVPVSAAAAAKAAGTVGSKAQAAVLAPAHKSIMVSGKVRAAHAAAQDAVPKVASGGIGAGVAAGAAASTAAGAGAGAAVGRSRSQLNLVSNMERRLESVRNNTYRTPFRHIPRTEVAAFKQNVTYSTVLPQLLAYMQKSALKDHNNQQRTYTRQALNAVTELSKSAATAATAAAAAGSAAGAGAGAGAARAAGVVRADAARPAPFARINLIDAPDLNRSELVAGVNQIAERFKGQNINYVMLNKILSEVSQYYHNQGYSTATAYLPVQNITAGELELGVASAVTGAVKVNNESSIRDSYLEYLLSGFEERFKGKPVQYQEIRNYMHRFTDLGIFNLRGNFEAADEAGLMQELNLYATDAVRPVTFTLFADNGGNDSSGRYRFGGSLNLLNPTGSADRLTLFYSRTDEQQNNFSLNYELPVNTHPTVAGMELCYSNYELGGIYRELGAKGNSFSTDLYLKEPLYRSEDVRVMWRNGFDYTALTDEFTTFDLELKKHTTKFYTELSGQKYYLPDGAMWAFNTRFSYGRLSADDALGLLDDDNFTKLETELYFNTMLGQDFDYAMTLKAQFGSSYLDGSEQFLAGGVDGLSAYEASALSGDSGILWRNDLNYTAYNDYDFRLNITPHLEYAKVYSSGYGDDSAWSAGLKFSAYYDGLSASLDLAHGLGTDPNYAVKEGRINFNFVYQFG